MAFSAASMHDSRVLTWFTLIFQKAFHIKHLRNCLMVWWNSWLEVSPQRLPQSHDCHQAVNSTDIELKPEWFPTDIPLDSNMFEIQPQMIEIQPTKSTEWKFHTDTLADITDKQYGILMIIVLASNWQTTLNPMPNSSVTNWHPTDNEYDLYDMFWFKTWKP